MSSGKLSTPVRLGAPVELFPGEWLHSAISRWAWQTFDVSRSAMFDAFGLSDVSLGAITALGTALTPQIAANISFATGIEEDRLRRSTMESLDERLLELNDFGEGQGLATVKKSGPWSWQAGTRYCPDCLRSNPGVFKLHWRSPWIYTCTLHRRILLDACPACSREIVEMRGRNIDRFDPSTCRASTAPNNATRRTPCGAKLEDTWEDVRLDENSIPYLAQQSILYRVQSGVGLDYLTLLQAAGTGLRGAKAFDEIAVLSGLDSSELRGLFDEEKHIGISPPKSAYAMAGLVGAAFALVKLPERASRAIIRRATFTRPPESAPRGLGYGPGSPWELVKKWSPAPKPFQAQILRALDRDLTIGQRILWDTAVDSRTMAAHGLSPYNPHKRAVGVPELLWPAWCSRFDVGGQVDEEALARALSFAVTRAGTTGALAHDDEKTFARVLRANVLGSTQQTHQLLAGISELAHTVDDIDIVIDYQRRAGLPTDDFLPQRHWATLAESINIDPGARRRVRNARRYLWQRLTGSSVRRLPPAFRMDQRRDDSGEYTVFRTRMTKELQEALDNYAEAYLRRAQINEPVTWHPKTTVDIEWPGAEIDDLDMELLHAMLLEGTTTHRRLEDALGVSTRRIVRAIDAAPPSVGINVTQIDWGRELLADPALPIAQSPEQWEEAI